MGVNDNRKYNRKKRAKQRKCTICGRDLDDERYMLCKECRDKQAGYMRMRRQKKSRYISETN